MGHIGAERVYGSGKRYNDEDNSKIDDKKARENTAGTTVFDLVKSMRKRSISVLQSHGAHISY